jgi:hypothetical protein
METLAALGAERVQDFPQIGLAEQVILLAYLLPKVTTAEILLVILLLGAFKRQVVGAVLLK